MSVVTAVFTHDTATALQSTAALVNTEGRQDESLRDVAALDAFVDEWRYTGSRRHDADELAGVQALRPVLRRLWAGDEGAVVALVNTLLAERRALPQLVAHDGWPWHLHATPAEAPLADRMAVEAAMAMVDVIRQRELDRLKVCAADDCAQVLVDLSRNSSKRYCSTTCANRVNVAAFRARRSTGG